VSYTALVETRGSTPQKSGAEMLVFADGSQVGTLGGGCVEAEVKRQAIASLHTGKREILTFQLDQDYGWDDGLICGGRMKMLVDAIVPGDDSPYLQRQCELAAAGAGYTEAIIIDPAATSGGQAGDRYWFDETGKQIAARSQVTCPDAVIDNLKPLIDRPRPYITEGVSYLPVLKRCRLIIVGGGHVGLKVAELASEVDFDIWVIDDRQEYCNAERFPQAQRLRIGSIDQTLANLQTDERTFCIIVTRGHKHDEEALFHLVNKPSRYLGMIGSKRKIRLIFDDLIREGISEEALQRVHAPLGLDIGSQTVPEIAVSIVAELIACRNLESRT